MNSPLGALALIIEDEPFLAEIFAEAMQMAGYDTVLARDGQTALNRLAEAVPDTVVLDLHLPLVPGTEILRRIRDDRRYAAVKVIVTTADSILGEVVEPEADLVLLKPLSFLQLRDMGRRLRPRPSA